MFTFWDFFSVRCRSLIVVLRLSWMEILEYTKRREKVSKIIKYKLNVYTKNIRRHPQFDIFGLYAVWCVLGFFFSFLI